MLKSTRSLGRLAVPALLVGLIAVALLPCMYLLPMVVHAAPSQPATFYFHKQSSKTINTVTSTLWANTTQAWSAVSQTEPRAGIRSGTPAVWDYYTEPVMPGNVTLTGPLTFTVYLSSSATTGGGTVTTGSVTEITQTGMPVPLATASATGAIGTAVSAYTFSINSNVYLLNAGGILHFSVTVSIPNNTPRTLTLYYDTGTYHGSVALSFQNRLGITSYAAYNQTGVQIGSYSRNWTLAGRLVSLQTVVYDALGVYDIGSATTTVTSPSGSTYISNNPLSRSQGTPVDYTGTWTLNITYSLNDPSGTYTSNLNVLDNNGVAVISQTQFKLYAVWGLGLQTMSSDPTPLAVNGVTVTVFTGSTPIFTGTSDATGTVVPSKILLRDDMSYAISSFWQGLLVNQTGPYTPSTSVTIPLRLSVYSVDLGQALRNGDNAVLSQQVTSLLILSPNGTTISPNSSQKFLLASGTYTINQALVRGVNVVPSTSPTFNPKLGGFTIDLQVYQVTVIVTDQNNRPLANAKVTLQLSGVTIYQGNTAADGSLVVKDIPKGQYLMTIDDGSKTSTTSVTVSQDTTSNIQMTPQSVAGPDWVGQSLGWVVLAGAVFAGLAGYRQYSHSRLGFKDEPFDAYLNRLIPGGIRDGESTLIYGQDGTGKTTVCEQLSYKSLLDGHPTVFLTYESSQEMRESMKRFHWDTSVYESQHLFQLIDCEIQAPGQGFGILEDFYDVAALNLNIASALDQATTKPRIFIDSLTDLALKSNPTSVLNMVGETKERVKKLQGQLFVTIQKSVPKSLLTKLCDTADNVIELTRGTDNGKAYTELTIRKNHGTRTDNLPARLTVDPARGLVFQIMKGTPKAELPLPSTQGSPSK